jgi:hypothetical protein
MKTLFGSIIAGSILILTLSGCGSSVSFRVPEGRPFTIVYQPSHQTDTGREYNEAKVCNAIAEAAIASASPNVRVVKVWSYESDSVHHARSGSNTKLDHTTALDSLGRISGYALELKRTSEVNADVFISLHNNGASKRNGCWGFVHEGDEMEKENRELARMLVKVVCEVSGLENLADHGDSEPNRNDYRCAKTGKLSFFSLDENVNKVPHRVLLEIGDNAISRDILLNPEIQKKIGVAIQKLIEELAGI